MTELLLRLRSSEPTVREQMLQEESEKGLHKFRLLGRAAGLLLVEFRVWSFCFPGLYVLTPPSPKGWS